MYSDHYEESREATSTVTAEPAHPRTISITADPASGYHVNDMLVANENALAYPIAAVMVDYQHQHEHEQPLVRLNSDLFATANIIPSPVFPSFSSMFNFHR